MRFKENPLNPEKDPPNPEENPPNPLIKGELRQGLGNPPL